MIKKGMIIAIGGSILMVNIQNEMLSLPLNSNLLKAKPARDPRSTAIDAELTATMSEFSKGGIISTAIPPIPTKLVTTFKNMTLKFNSVGGVGKNVGGQEK